MHMNLQQGQYRRTVCIKADSHIACHALIHTCHAAPLPYSSSAVSFIKVRVVAEISELLVQQFNRSSFCSVLLTLFTVVGMDRCEEDWYASDNNLRGTLRGSREKPNVGR